MAINIYASLRETFDLADFSVTAAAGGTTTVATNNFYFVYGVTRGGINLATELGQVAIAIGEKLEFTINATARPAGLDPFAFALGTGSTSDPTQAKLLAFAWTIDRDHHDKP